jgi:hypothetical protein
MINVLHTKQSGLQDQPSQNKENVPPSFEQDQQENKKKLIYAIL